MTAKQVKAALAKHGEAGYAERAASFLKTGPGEYAEGDVFLGVRVPDTRRVAKTFHELPLSQCDRLIQSEVHEHRLCTLFILIHHMKSRDPAHRKAVFDLYVKRIDHVNHWDLVDSSAHHIAGEYLLDRSRSRLDRWAKARSLWRRRIAMVATYAFIKRDDFADTLRLADTLLEDNEDLIHKAVGWMLREMGNRDVTELETFLKPRYGRMPRTMLRYAIERLPEKRRRAYIEGRV